MSAEPGVSLAGTNVGEAWTRSRNGGSAGRATVRDSQGGTVIVRRPVVFPDAKEPPGRRSRCPARTWTTAGGTGPHRGSEAVTRAVPGTSPASCQYDAFSPIQPSP